MKSSDIKNSQVKSSDIKNGQVRSADVADGGIAGLDLANDTLGGTQINEGSLGKVPNATDADDAAEVTGTLEYRNGFDVVSMQFQASRIIPLRTPVHTCHASGHVFLS